MTKIGHNIAGDQLRIFVERIERLEVEKSELAVDIREIYAEAKAVGFDAPAIRQIIRERRMDSADLQERETILDLYRSALGMLTGTPLGDVALARAGQEAE